MRYFIILDIKKDRGWGVCSTGTHTELLYSQDKAVAQLTLTSLDYLMFSAFISKEEPVVVRPTGSALSLQPRWEARPVCIPPEHPGPEVSKKRIFSPAFPKKKKKKKQASYKLPPGQQGCVSQWVTGLGLSWTEKSPGNVSSCRCLQGGSESAVSFQQGSRTLGYH